MFFFWIVLIAAASIIWAFVALKKDKNKKEIEQAKEDIMKGRVVFHSSDAGDSSSS